MRITSLKVLAATAACAVVPAVAAGAAQAAAGPPPPPKATGGQTVTQVAAGLKTPTAFAFGAGQVFEADGGNTENGPPNGGVYVLRNGVGVKLPGAPMFAAGLAWHQGALYVSGGVVTGPTSATWTLQRWSGWNGATFSQRRVIYTAPKGFDGFNGMAFGPNGRLYVGVDVGLTNHNDHGAAKTPYVYSILSLKPNGSNLKVYATGMRQPWQMAFPAGSSVPLVSNLGQDKGAKNPPDSILRVRPGDNYGFPKCNHTPGSPCKGFARPFRRFSPHTDVMGMAIIGSRLYVTSFLSTTGRGPGGEVLSMPVTGGPLKPVVTGFVAPTVGLGARGNTLYIGELTGMVFSVRP